jgi:hypothetical protein
MFFVSLGSIRRFFAGFKHSTLYLNVEFLQIGAQLLRVLVMDHVHAQPPGTFEVQGAVVDEQALLGGPLGDFESDAKNRLFWFSRANVARTEKHQEIAAQVKCLDPVLIQFERFVVYGADQISPRSSNLIENGSGFRKLLGLSEHERGEFFAGKGPRPVEKSAVEILIQSDMPGIECGERKVVPVLKLFPIQMKCGRRIASRTAIPPIRQDDSANIPKQRRDFGQARRTSASKTFPKCDLFPEIVLTSTRRLAFS